MPPKVPVISLLCVLIAQQCLQCLRYSHYPCLVRNGLPVESHAQRPGSHSASTPPHPLPMLRCSPPGHTVHGVTPPNINPSISPFLPRPALPPAPTHTQILAGAIGDAPAVAQLLELGSDPFKTDSAGHTPRTAAAKRSAREVGASGGFALAVGESCLPSDSVPGPCDQAGSLAHSLIVMYLHAQPTPFSQGCSSSCRGPLQRQSFEPLQAVLLEG